MTEKLERLVAAGIQLIPVADLTGFFVFERDGYIALVERRGEGFGNIGSAGLLTPKGLAPVMHRGDGAFFVSKGFSQPAEPEQLETLRRFQQDLIDALA